MAVTLKTKKAKPSKPVAKTLPGDLETVVELSATQGLDVTNRSTRTAIGWIADGSPSMTGFTEAQLTSAKSVVEQLRQMPATSRSVMMNIVQIGTPPVSTGFADIGAFQVPGLHAPHSTPLHSALNRMVSDMSEVFAKFRGEGIERTESVVVITTDGHANDSVDGALELSVRNYLAFCKKWSVTNIVVGVGNNLNPEMLKSLANAIPPFKIDELDAACLMPFIQKIARRVTGTRLGQAIEIEQPDGLETLG